MPVVFSYLALSASSCGANRTECADYPIMPHTCLWSLPMHRKGYVCVWGGGLPFSIYKVFVTCAFISGIFKVKFWCSLNQEATCILVEMWWLSYVPDHFPQLSFPSLTEAEASSHKSPHWNVDEIKLLWSGKNTFVLWVNVIPQTSLVTYRPKW